ncbi:MAG: CAP domain-containing protein [Clostridia bacterium]|nr:CAP domain-containing protein [Clostridia bacterium]
MKKQIALIIISMLAAMSASAQNVNYNEMCNYPQRTPICEMGPGVIQPDLDEIFGTCPEIPDFEVKPEIPETPEKPDTDIPVIPEEPVVPEEPPFPETPENPDIPEVPDTETETPDTSLASQVLALVNAERAKYGLSSLTYDATLGRAADIRAVEIKKLFSHTRPNGQSCFTVLDEIGYSYRTAGENIAYGQRSPEEVMTAWMNSEGHRANILGENYTHIGIGVYESGGVIYWSQFFAN